MALETGTYVDDLVLTNPTGSDDPVYGDDHIRLLKTTIKNTLADADAPAVQGYVTASGTANALTVTLSPVPSAYTDKMFLRVKTASRNTGATTINVNSLGAKNIKKGGGQDLEEGDLRGSYFYDMVYDGTDFMLVREQFTHIRQASFSDEKDLGTKSTDFEVNWNDGNKQKVTLSGAATMTFVDPAGPSALQLKVTQDGTGGRVLTHPTILTQNGAGISVTSTASATDIIFYYFDGTNYFASITANWS